MLGSILYIIVIATIVVNTMGFTFMRQFAIGANYEVTINLDWSVLSFKKWKMSSNDVYLPVFMFTKTTGAWRIGIPMLFVTKMTFNK